MYSKSKKPGASDKTSFARSSKNSKKSGKVLLPETPAQLQVDVSEAEYASESGLGIQAMQRLLQARAIQPKLKINQPGDKYEQEADRVANEVMRMPEPDISTSSQYASVSAPSRIQRMCSECEEEELQRQPIEEEEEEELLQAKEIPGQTQEINSNIETNINAVRSGGRPLLDSVRNYFEPRFGYDFSEVRIHTDSRAAESSQALKARAFTLGNNIVFNNREYAPTSLRGKQLLAHELTHVVQQQGTVLNTIQRQHKCENDPWRAPTMICPPATSAISGPSLDIFFDIESSTLSREGEAALQHFVRNWHDFGGTVRVDGFASCDAGPNLNWPLSCDRGEAVAHELLLPLDPTLAGIDPSFVVVFANGETDRFSTSLAPNRRATVTLIPLPPPPPSPSRGALRCGPDVTKWLIEQMHQNQNHPAIKTAREVTWPRYLPLFNIGWTAGFLNDFKNLVRPGGAWDFKRSESFQGKNSKGVTCPSPDCRRSVTLCDNCLDYDVPGNIHYGWVGTRAGLRSWILHFGAGVVQEGALTDDPMDSLAIDIGIEMAKKGTALCPLIVKNKDNLRKGPKKCTICQIPY